jgi:hypothetical protein
MRLASTIFTWLVLGVSAAVAVEGTDAKTVVSTPSTVETVAQVMDLPAGTKLSGRGVSLIEALAFAADGPRQLEVTHAYWQLSAMAAEHQLRQQQAEALTAFQARPGDEAILRTARAAASAALDEAALAVIEAQHELAQRALLPTSDPLPLAADRPHVGSYRTRFAEIFAGRPAPPRGQLLDRTLPLRREAIDRRAEAVRAADAAFATTQKAYLVGQAGLEVVLSSMTQWGYQRQQLIRAVADYNHEIAEYVVSVVARPGNPASLVAMLIKTPLSPANPTTLDTAWGPGNPGRNRPTLAPPRDAVRQAAAQEPIVEPRRSPTRAADDLGATPASGPFGVAPPLVPIEGDKPSTVPPSEPKWTPPELPKLKVIPTEPEPSQKPTPTITNKPIVAPAAKPAIQPSDNTSGASVAPSGLYPALVGATPAAQAKQLAAVLHGTRDMSSDAGQSATLADCLRMQPQGDRRELIAAYWQTRTRAAERQAIAQQAKLLDDVATLLGEAPPRSPAGLRLEAARRATAANLIEARAGLLASQFELTRLAGRPLEGGWLLPSTVPHADAYLLKLDSPSRESADSWSARRREALIPPLGETVRRRALAVVEADEARTEAVAQFQGGAAPLDRVLECTFQQTDQTLSFLQMLCNYNRAIADYVATTLPENIPADQLAAALVIEP